MEGNTYPPRIGEVVDSLFRVERHLGSGAAGEVYAVTLMASWQGLPQGSPLALKWYNPKILTRENRKAIMMRRLREAELGRKLRQRNLVKAYNTENLWGDASPRYLIMELLEGQPLDQFDGHRASLFVYSTVLQIIDGLATLHSAGIIHRDLKPANLFICRDGRVVILDLGVARPLTDSSITATKAFLGTLRYSAPEWLFGEESTPASDIYSVGAILYWLVTGHEIFEDVEPFAAQVIAVREDMPKLILNDRRPSMAYALDVAQQSLMKKPFERPTLDELRDFFSVREQSRLWTKFRTKRLKSIRRYRFTELWEFLPPNTATSIPMDELDLHLASVDSHGLLVALARVSPLYREKLQTEIGKAIEQWETQRQAAEDFVANHSREAVDEHLQELHRSAESAKRNIDSWDRRAQNDDFDPSPDDVEDHYYINVVGYDEALDAAQGIYETLSGSLRGRDDKRIDPEFARILSERIAARRAKESDWKALLEALAAKNELPSPDQLD